ncbi:ATP-binding protein [Streptomyces sp. NPDC059349]|uniref:ATP-binding protein n=1 Tax=Streptomyces sp. NPDC059349 TaxID=3346808 RepID=UPI0036786880
MPELLHTRAVGLVGRGGAAAALEGLLRAERLVTVAGPGGVGKSALAAEVVRRMRREPWSAKGTADLATLDIPGLVPHALARALRIDGDPAVPQLPALAAAIGRRPVLLVVDTCERQAAECAATLLHLVQACPELRVLATSRVPLDTPVTFPLPPLTPGGAARLLRTAARALGAPEDPDHEPVRRVCAALGGLPLALRIAAGQLKHHDADDLLSLIGRPEHLLDLPAPMPGLPHRLRTLRASLRWSQRLCPPGERLLWARASVFTGPFTLSDTVTVCADDRLSADELARAFEGLAAHFLFTPEPSSPGAFRMTAATRAYGRHLLERLGEDAEFRRRCLAHCLRNAASSPP